jgi:hypothetical protein
MLAQKVENLKYTPWVNKLGHDAFRLWQTYTESPTLPRIQTIQGKNGQELLTKFIEMGKHFSEEEKTFWKQNPHHLIPLRLPNRHAFNLIPSEGLMEAWNCPSSAKQWINQHVIKPGLKVANSPLSASTREKMIQYALKEWMDPQKAPIFLHHARFLPAAGVSVKNFCSSLLTLTQTVGLRPGVNSKELSFALSTRLCKTLPAPLKIELQNSILPFADTNWHKGIHDIHFGFGINPGTGNLEIMEILDDKTHIMVIDQSFISEPWEIIKK